MQASPDYTEAINNCQDMSEVAALFILAFGIEYMDLNNPRASEVMAEGESQFMDVVRRKFPGALPYSRMMRAAGLAPPGSRYYTDD